MIELATVWFEVELHVTYDYYDESGFDSLDSSLSFLRRDFAKFREYIEGIAADFFYTQLENGVPSPDLTRDIIDEIPEDEFPLTFSDNLEPFPDEETDSSNNPNSQKPYFPG